MGGRVVSEIRNRVLRTVSETSDSFLCTSPHVSAKGVELVRNTDLPDSVRLIFPRQSYTPEFWRHPQRLVRTVPSQSYAEDTAHREHGAREEGSMTPCLCNVTAELVGLTTNPNRHKQQLSKRFFSRPRTAPVPFCAGVESIQETLVQHLLSFSDVFQVENSCCNVNVTEKTSVF